MMYARSSGPGTYKSHRTSAASLREREQPGGSGRARAQRRARSGRGVAAGAGAARLPDTVVELGEHLHVTGCPSSSTARTLSRHLSTWALRHGEEELRGRRGGGSRACAEEGPTQRPTEQRGSCGRGRSVRCRARGERVRAAAAAKHQAQPGASRHAWDQQCPAGGDGRAGGSVFHPAVPCGLLFPLRAYI